MHKYQIVMQTTVTPGARLRAPRSLNNNEVETVEIIATSLTNALLKLGNRLSREKRSPRIVSAEEVLDFDSSEITDADITQALTVGLPDYMELDPDDYVGIDIYMADDFLWTANSVAEALRENGIIPGLTLSVTARQDEAPDFVMVEIYDTASNTYRAVGREDKRLIEDRSLVGWPGVISIARALLGIVESERLL